MAQLRDAQTSEIIAEGTPAALVFLAEKLGRENVLFDGVGLGFNPDAVIEAHKAEMKGLKDIRSDDPSADAAQARLRTLTKEQKVTKKQVDEINAVTKSAREREVETLPHIVLE